MNRKLSLEIVVREQDADELLDTLDRLLSTWTDGRARWGVGVSLTTEPHQYEEDGV